jgi:hypothetical protein
LTERASTVTAVVPAPGSEDALAYPVML